MDAGHWDVHHFHSGSLRKRPRDVDSAPTQASVAGIGHNNHLGGHDPLVESDWKRRRNTSKASTSTWETSVQTSLWLAQQNNILPRASVDREDIDHSRRRIGFQQVSSTDELSSPMPDWSRHTEGINGPQSLEARGSYSQDPVATGSSYKISDQARHPTEASISHKDIEETAAPQPRRPPNLAGIEPRMEPRCGKCFRSEPLLREATFNLSKLSESLASGPLSEIISQSRTEGLMHDQIPHVVEIHRVLDLILEASNLAKQVAQAAPEYLQNVKKESPLPANNSHNDLEAMKRRFLADTQEALEKQRRRSSDVHSSLVVQSYSSILPDPATIRGSPRRASTTGVTSNDLLPPIRSQSPPHLATDGYGARLPSMKPPPTPSRQLPSPPGRSQPSPPSYNIPSPSSLLYPQSVTSTSAPPPTALPNILHPLSPTSSSSLGAPTAIQAHTAALQHEVSVKKYALQTLQSEHDKLLAAFRRSQTRARALEEKQVASDLEINTLAEERVRLLTQVQELEQSIADVSKSRDEFRQAAVKGGAQYVKIVRMASQLEMMAGEERREWKRKLEENKATIDALQKAHSGLDPSAESIDPTAEAQADASTPSFGPAEELKKEIHRLRTRCMEMESTLEKIRNEKRTFDEAVAALGASGERVFRSAGGDVVADTKLGRTPITSSLPTEVSEDV